MLAHIHIMKTAGQTVCDILRTTFGAAHCDLRAGDLATQADLEFARKFYPNLQSIAGHSIRPWSELAEISALRFFTFLREPESRCLSHYQFECVRNGKEIDFVPWLEQNANYQTSILSGNDQAADAIEILRDRIGFVGLVEEFDSSLSLLRNWSGFSLHLQYQSRNIARDSSIKSRVLADPRSANALRECNAADAVVYQHVREQIYPRLEAEYGSARKTSGNAGGTPSKLWPTTKRDLLYKPAAKLRERLRIAGL